MGIRFFVLWSAILAFDSALMAVLSWVARSAQFCHLRHTPAQKPAIPSRSRRVVTLLNSLFSLSVYGIFFYFLGRKTLHPGWPGVSLFVGEVVSVLVLYDLSYYFIHRLMHHRKLMRHCHAVHHRARSPLANESAFLHPLDNLAGVGLLLLATVVVGPISTTSFLTIFFIHTSVNIIVHCNLKIPHPAFRLLNFYVEKHNAHHGRSLYNYASIFPFWDYAFGTSS